MKAVIMRFGYAKPAVLVYICFHNDLDCLVAQDKLGMSLLEDVDQCVQHAHMMMPTVVTLILCCTIMLAESNA